MAMEPSSKCGCGKLSTPMRFLYCRSTDNCWAFSFEALPLCSRDCSSWWMFFMSMLSARSMSFLCSSRLLCGPPRWGERKSSFGARFRVLKYLFL